MSDVRQVKKGAHTTYSRRIIHALRALMLSAGFVVGAASAGTAVHAGGPSPVTPVPLHVPCRELAKQARMLIDAPFTTVVIEGSCFLGRKDYVSVYDQSQHRSLTGTWATITANRNGNFALTLSGAKCYDRLEAIAYDTGWNSYTNSGNWQYGSVDCQPK